MKNDPGATQSLSLENSQVNLVKASASMTVAQRITRISPVASCFYLLLLMPNLKKLHFAAGSSLWVILLPDFSATVGFSGAFKETQLFMK